MQGLTLFLNSYRDKNFITFNRHITYELHEENSYRYYYLNCENFMWKINRRSIPYGIQFYGGNDWFILSSKFSNYVINSNDENLVNLKKMFYYKIHPLEVRKIFTMFSKFKG